jgi:hypothetical protein
MFDGTAGVVVVFDRGGTFVYRMTSTSPDRTNERRGVVRSDATCCEPFEGFKQTQQSRMSLAIREFQRIQCG